MHTIRVASGATPTALHRSRAGCLSCAFARRSCGGLGAWRRWQLPRQLGALCNGYSACNTCRACCDATWVMPSGASCEACEARRCTGRRGAVAPLGKKGSAPLGWLDMGLAVIRKALHGDREIST